MQGAEISMHPTPFVRHPAKAFEQVTSVGLSTTKLEQVVF